MGLAGDQVDLVAAVIAQRLTQYPESADTETGIQRWWMPPWCTVSIEVVREALNRLQAKGIVRTEHVAGGQVLYRRAR